jgi:dimethylargininase
MVKPLGVQVLSFDLPVWNGPGSCLHLMSIVSVVGPDLALVFPQAMPVGLFEELRARGVRMLEAPAGEFMRSRTISANVLALAPTDCVIVDGYPETAEVLRAAGCRVAAFSGQELCIKMEGGPTCLTRPLWRA